MACGEPMGHVYVTCGKSTDVISEAEKEELRKIWEKIHEDFREPPPTAVRRKAVRV